MINDLPLFVAVNTFARATPWLHPFMLALSTYAPVVFTLLLVGGWWLARRDSAPRLMAAAVWAPVAVLLAVGVNQPVSAAVGELRPCRALPTIVVIGKCGRDFSFPSDHAVMAGAATVGLLVVTRRALAWVAVLAALLVSFSRVYVAAHYPHDVLAGLLLGAVVSLAGWIGARAVLTRIVVRLTHSPLRVLLSAARPAASAGSAREMG